MMLQKKTDLPDGERKHRARNPWPVESDTETSVFGGSRTIGGGFGGGGGFGSSFSASKSGGFGFGTDRVAGGFGVISDSGFGFSSRGAFNSARGAAGSQSETAMDRRYPRGTAPSATSSRRPRTTRRNGRRGRGPNTHCYHCGEHGHFSKVCPKKEHLGEHEEEEPLNSDTFIESPAKVPSRFVPINEAVSHPPAAPGAESEHFHSDSPLELVYNAKLENQKARESYYNAFGYSAGTTSSLSCPAVQSPKKAADVVDKFSEELDNALKMSGIEKRSDESDTDGWESRTSSHHATPPTAATQSMSSLLNPPTALQKTSPRAAAAAPFSAFGKSAKKVPMKPHFGAAGDEKASPPPSSECELLTIETRRSVMRDGEYHFEEQTIISFPRNLPDNVRVITAQFLPVQNASAR